MTQLSGSSSVPSRGPAASLAIQAAPLVPAGRRSSEQTRSMHPGIQGISSNPNPEVRHRGWTSPRTAHEQGATASRGASRHCLVQPRQP